jgi:hypothetical protein
MRRRSPQADFTDLEAGLSCRRLLKLRGSAAEFVDPLRQRADPLGTVLGGHRPGLKRSKVPFPSLLSSRQFGARRGKLLGNVRLAFRPPSGGLSQSAADKIGVAVGLMA